MNPSTDQFYCKGLPRALKQRRQVRPETTALQMKYQTMPIPEHAIRERLESIEKDSAGKFLYQESAAFQQVIRGERCSPLQLLKRVYRLDP